MRGSADVTAVAGPVEGPAIAASDTVDGAGIDPFVDAPPGADVDPEPPVEDAPVRRSRLVPVGLAVLAVLLVVRMFVAEPVRTDGNSMEPTLHDGEALVIDTLSYRFHDPAVGDIVVAQVPTTGERVVKRVVAVGGDTVGLEDGVLVRNGRPVDEPYADQDQMGGTYWGPVEVPAGQVFLMGDNRLESVDSRHYGPVSVDDIDGRYAFRLWPF